jgi:hypothetical protein
MSISTIIGIVAVIVSILSIVFAIYYAHRNRKIKLLAYDISGTVPIARAVSPEKDYNLSVVFQHQGKPEERLDSVYVRFLRFANLGRESIRKDDIAPANPLRISVEGVRTLDITLSGVSRSVNRVALTKQHISEDNYSANITFDYLDHKDGAVIEILTVGGKGTPVIYGDIIGIPSGIRKVDNVSSSSTRLLSGIGTILAILLIISAFVISFFVFYWVTGAWTNVWLLVLPFLALFIPSIIIAIPMILWTEVHKKFPSPLELPKWFQSLTLFHEHSRIVPDSPDLTDNGFPHIESS